MKNKRSVNGSKNNTNNTNNTLNKAKTNGNKAIKPAGSNTKMYASATGNISVEDANNLLKVLVGDDYEISAKKKGDNESGLKVQADTADTKQNKKQKSLIVTDSIYNIVNNYVVKNLANKTLIKHMKV